MLQVVIPYYTYVSLNLILDEKEPQTIIWHWKGPIIIKWRQKIQLNCFKL